MPPTVPVRTGDLRERVRLESMVSTTDSHGGTATTWSLLGVVNAAVWPIGGREAVLAEQTTGVLTTTVWIRYRTGLSVKGRLRLGTRVLQVEDVSDPDGRRAWLRLICSEVAA